MKNPNHLAVVAQVVLAMQVGATTLVYEQSFTSGAEAAVLNGTRPTTGEKNWVASTRHFQADGDFAEGAGSATIAFTPTDGKVYTLDASFRNLKPTSTLGAPEQDWVAVGFAKGQTANSGHSARFTAPKVLGKAWMLYRGAGTEGTFPNVTHLGDATSGTPSPENWSDAGLSTTFGGGIDMRVVLDTSGGAGNWTATWYAKLPTSETFTEVRAATKLVNEEINSVGVAISGGGFEGHLSCFRLASTP